VSALRLSGARAALAQIAYAILGTWLQPAGDSKASGQRPPPESAAIKKKT
jgi:hypothetical protein